MQQTHHLYLAKTRLKNSHTNSDRLPSSRMRSSRGSKLTSFISFSPRTTIRTCSSSPSSSFTRSTTRHTRCTSKSSDCSRLSDAPCTLFTTVATPNSRPHSSAVTVLPTTTNSLHITPRLNPHASSHASRNTPSWVSATPEQGSRSGMTRCPSFSSPQSDFASSSRYNRGYTAFSTRSADCV